MKSNPSHHGGGAAMAGGQRFQAQVTAYWAAHILLQTPMGRQFDLPSDDFATRLDAETEDSVDDLRVSFTSGALLYAQCKRSISLSDSLSSELSSVFEQFYRELAKNDANSKPDRRFVLYYEKDNARLRTLGEILSRFRSLPPESDLGDAAVNADEKDIAAKIESLLDQLQTKEGFQQLATRRRELLRSIYLVQLKLESSGADYISTLNALQNGVIENISSTDGAMTILHRLADDLMATRRGIDRSAIQTKLINENIALKIGASYRRDFAVLEELRKSSVSIQRAEHKVELIINDRTLVINRPIVAAMADEANAGKSFLVIGDAGVGKTGCLMSLASTLQESGCRLWYWPVDSLPYNSAKEIARVLELNNSWRSVFDEAARTGNAVLMLDGLDGLRDTSAQKAYRQLINLALAAGIIVVASIRTFDLRYASELAELFRSYDTPNSYRDANFINISHFKVRELEPSELRQVLEFFPEVANILAKNERLVSVVTNLFSLSLLCELINDGAVETDFSTISTQAELFEKFWQRRVEGNPNHLELTRALTAVSTEMVEARSLQVNVNNVQVSSELYDQLFSLGLFRHPLPRAGHIPDSGKIEFNHHLLFDYVAERLFIRPRRSQLPQELESNNSWGLFLRPSLVLFYRLLWRYGRGEFWQSLLAIQSAEISYLEKIAGFLVVAQEARDSDDLRPIVEGCSKQENSKGYWFQILQGTNLVGSELLFRHLFARGNGGLWLEFAKRLIDAAIPQTVFAGTWILNMACEYFDKFSPEVQTLFNDAARGSLSFYLNQAGVTAQNLAVGIKCVGKSFRADPENSAVITRKLISDSELARYGYLTAGLLADQIPNIWDFDAQLVADVYVAVFGYQETDTSKTSISNSQILSLVSHRAQDYKMSYYVLAQHFRAFLNLHSVEATLALIRIQTQGLTSEESDSTKRYTFEWDGAACRITVRKYEGLFSINIDRDDDREKLVSIWSDFLQGSANDEGAFEKWELLKDLLIKHNESLDIWAALLNAGAAKPEFYASRLRTMLLEPSLYGISDLHYPVRNALRSFTTVLQPADVSEIEEQILGLSPESLGWTKTKDSNEWLIRTKTELLLCIPENQRHDRSIRFLENVDGKLLDYLKSRKEPEIAHFAPVDTPERWPEHRELLDLANSITGDSNEKLTEESLPSFIDRLESVEKSLAQLGPIDDELSDILRFRIIEGYTRVAKSDLTIEPELENRILDVFLLELSNPSDPPSEEVLKSFDQFQSWGPSAYKSAADGFIWLAAKRNHLSDEIKNQLARLSEDSSPAVRMFLGENLWRFLVTWEPFVWETLGKWINKLGTSGYQGVLSLTFWGAWFWWLRERDVDRSKQLLLHLLATSREKSASPLREICGRWLSLAYIYVGEDWAWDELQTATLRFGDNIDELNGALIAALNCVLSEQSDKNIAEDQKERAFEVITTLIESATVALHSFLEQRGDTTKDWEGQEPPDWTRRVFRTLESISIRIQKAGEEFAKGDAAETTVTEWWTSIEPVIEGLLKSPQPPFAYHLICGIEPVLSLDIEKGFHWMNLATKASAPYGLTNETLAADKTIEILERVLAEHRASLALDSKLRRDFVEILDAYLQAGWPRAVQLAVRIESIFR